MRPFCRPSVVHTSYFDCVMKATALKVKVTNMFGMLIIWGKVYKKITSIYNSFEKMNPIKGLSHPVKKVWISSLTLTLIFWWIELAILRSDGKVYQSFIFNFGDIWKRKLVLYKTLNAFFHTGKPVSSRVLVW